MTNRIAGAAAGVAFLATIVAANWVTTRYGLIPVGFGLLATAGTYFAGAAFVLRDSVQDGLGRAWVLALVLAGGLVSFATGSGRIAVASACAFLVSELVDFAIYTPLRERGYVRAAVASNVAGAIVDTVVFLLVAGFGLAQAFAGQVVGKLTVTLVVVALVTLARLAMRRPVVTA